MKINLSKSAKRALSLALAFAMLIGSLFTANVGINLKASATTTTYDVWDGTADATFEDADGDGVYEIHTAEQLYAMVTNDGKVNGVKASFKVADGIKAFYLTDVKNTIDDNGSSTDDIMSAVKNSTLDWNNIGFTYYGNAGFVGSFDGNGVTIYGMRIIGNHASNTAYRGGFIPTIYNDGDTVTIENVSFKYSYLESQCNNPWYGVVVGSVGHNNKDKDDGADDTLGKQLIFNNVRVEDAKFDFNSSGSAAGVRGGLCGLAYPATVTVNNCFASNISAENTYKDANGNPSTVVVTAAPFVSSSNKTVTVNNSIAISDTSGQINTNNSSYIIATANAANAKGAAAMANMPALDWSGTWFATNGYPELRALHNLTFSYVDTKTHKYTCSDCTLTTAIPHSFVVNIEDETAICSDCGAQSNDVYDIWDGTKATSYAAGSGTKEDPYIITTVEQLFKMVRDEGVMRDANGNKINKDGVAIDDSNFTDEVAAYYKVADFVGALYINDTRSYETQAAFEAAAAAGSLKNWSGDLVKESCIESPSNSGHSHSGGYPYSFVGYFDGNGATIYGLYSMVSTSPNGMAPGTGFVPGLNGDGTIKNVVFDTCYVKNNSSNAAVITSSTGANADPSTSTYCNPQRTQYTANAYIMNVAVRNAYVEASGHFDSDYSDTTTDDRYCYVAGIMTFSQFTSIQSGKEVRISNCLFDSTNSTLVTANVTYQVKNGIVSARNNFGRSISVVNCLSVGEGANNYDISSAHTVAGQNSTTINSVFNSYTTATNATSGTVVNNYTSVNDMPMLNWSAWDCSESTITKYGTPMPKAVSSWKADMYYYNADIDNNCVSAYKDMALNSQNPDALFTDTNYPELRSNDTGYSNGVFAQFAKLMGSGTQADPYIISDAITLYQIIASGGTNRGVPQHFKLGCDIDLGALQWVDAADYIHSYGGGTTFYDYNAFSGSLDGNGHTITGMFTARDGENVGFIPELASGGVIKNINFRNCYAYSNGGSAGVIAGSTEAGSTIENCSIEDSFSTNFAGGSATITNCYSVGIDGTLNYNNGAPELDGEVWYGIKNENGTYTARLVALAKTMPCADIDGNGIGEEYTTSDATALKNYLLRDPNYLYVYGDVSGNGITNVSDLIALRREMKGDEWTALDGFWKNVKSGNIKIYYNDADNYDFARKLELYLEQVALGTDIEKVSNGTGSEFAINIVTSGNASDWSYNYNIPSAVLTITGGSFTAVEAAVEAFIANANLNSNPESANGSIDSDKTAVDLSSISKFTGGTYHYAWGDEFNSAINDTVSYDKWTLRSKSTYGVDVDESEYSYMRPASDTEALGINVVDETNGTLTLKRGFTTNTAGREAYYFSGLSSKNSMLFNGGYLEMKATLPCDGYAFPAWWLLTYPNINNNIGYNRSLYSKVYEKNPLYNRTSANFTPTDPTTYMYELPTQTLEIDLFEVIQKPTVHILSSSRRSDDNAVKFNVHKWYPAATLTTDSQITVYNLNWDQAANGFDSIFVANKADDGKYYKDANNSIIYVNEKNLETGSVNGSITNVGEGGLGSIEQDMSSYVTNYQIKENRYGFLWTDTTMTFIVYIPGTTGYTDSDILYSKVVSKDAFNFQDDEIDAYAGFENWGFDQYAYMLIENHCFTGSYSNTTGWTYANASELNDCDMVIDYVRLYQLDGERDIVTPESERDIILAR